MDTRPPPRETFGSVDYVAFAAPVVLVAAFFVTYCVSPTAYLTYIIEFSRRETQAVEILTWTAALGGAITLFICGAILWRRARRTPGASKLPGGATFILLVGLAAFFFAGEELSWGQTWFHWKTPSEMKGISRETNLHNGVLSHAVHLAGNLFIVGMFIVLPILWSQRHRLRTKLPADWTPGIAEWPVATCALLGLLMPLPKQLWVATHTAAEKSTSLFYDHYLEEIFEQKEMLFAIAMLIYALYRIRAVRRERAMTIVEKTSAA